MTLFVSLEQKHTKKKVSQSFVGFLFSLHNDRAYILKLNLLTLSVG